MLNWCRLVIVVCLCPLLALANPPNAELQALHDADQADRRGGVSSGLELQQRDAQRRTAVLALLNSGALRNAEDHYHAAMVLQHGGAVEDIRLAHALSTIAAQMDPEDKRAKWLIAASWDRLLMRMKQNQWYGTQYYKDASGKFVMHPVHPNAVSDAEREALGVPRLETAQRQLDQQNGNWQIDEEFMRRPLPRLN